MDLKESFPLICSAIDATKFLDYANILFVKREGSKQSSTVRSVGLEFNEIVNDKYRQVCPPILSDTLPLAFARVRVPQVGEGQRAAGVTVRYGGRVAAEYF
jgi:hypothetical protein